METTWEQLLLLADSDFISFVLLSHCGISEGTSLWMAPHSIEKYLKSLLLKSDPDFKYQSYSHKLNDLWSESKNCFSKNNLFQTTAYQTLINELNMENRNQRPDIHKNICPSCCSREETRARRIAFIPSHPSGFYRLAVDGRGHQKGKQAPLIVSFLTGSAFEDDPQSGLKYLPTLAS